MYLKTEKAPEIIRLAEKERDSGSQYIVLETRPMEAQLAVHDLEFFKTLDDALDYLDEKETHQYVPGFSPDEHPLYYQHIDAFLKDIRQENLPAITTPSIQIDGINDNQLNSKTMNLNNLDDLKKEVKDLGFNPKVADELEKNMKPLPGHFTIKDQFPGDRGVVDMTLHFHKSGQSDAYNLNKFEVTAGKMPPTVDGQQYMVLTENKQDKEKPLVKTFDSPNEAIDFFKKQKGNSELALGESAESKQILASKENGKDNYINPDFRSAYYRPAVKQTFYLKDGQGFSARQAANMVQDRTVFRDNMMTRDGEPYKAWVRLDFEQKKDDWGNHRFKQFHHPTFGFDLEKTLNDYKIRELADPARKAEIMEAMRHGDRVPVTAVDKENKEVKVMAEAVPRYSKLDFHSEKGARIKREQFAKPITNNLSQGRGQGKNKEKELEQGQGMKV